MDVKASSNYHCSKCNGTFIKRCSLRKHYESVHKLDDEQAIAELMPNLKNGSDCYICSNRFRSIHLLQTHLSTGHGVQMNFVEQDFESMQAFNEWMAKEEENSRCSFYIPRGAQKTADDRKRYYYRCNRYGEPKGSRSRRKGKTCVADIVVIETPDGNVHIKYQKTHTGHEPNVKSRAKRIRLTESNQEPGFQDSSQRIVPRLDLQSIDFCTSALESLDHFANESEVLKKVEAVNAAVQDLLGALQTEPNRVNVSFQATEELPNKRFEQTGLVKNRQKRVVAGPVVITSYFPVTPSYIVRGTKSGQLGTGLSCAKPAIS